jgi:hypothetical protein
LAFNAGISSVNEAGKIEFFKDTLTSFLENCPVVSSLEQSYPKILYPGISSEEFSSLQEKCSPESAYWLYLSGVIANKNKPSIEKSIIKQLDKMSSKLRWQEKILFKLLMSPGKVN